MTKTLTNILNESMELELAIIDNAGELTPAIMDRLTVNAIETREKLDSYDIVMERFEVNEKFYKQKADQFRLMSKAFSDAQDKMKAHLKFTMQERGLSEVSGNDVRFKLTNTTPSLNIIPELIPESYKYQVVSQEIDKAKIKQDLVDGVIIEGAELKTNVALRKYNNRG